MQQQTKWVQIKIQGKNIPRRSYHSSVIFENKLYVYGGYYINTGTLGDFYSIDLTVNASTFEPVRSEGEYPGLRQNQSCILYKKQMVIFGGKINSFDSCNLTYTFDLVASKWTRLETHHDPPPIDGHCGCLWGQKMIVYGGFIGGDVGKFSSSIYALDLSTLQWQCLFDCQQKHPQGSFPCPRSNAGATIIADSLFMFGGTNIDQKFGDLWEFDLVAREWKEVQQQNPPESRNGHLLFSYNGMIMLFGGIHDLTHEKNDLLVFKKGEWFVVEMDTSHSKDEKHDIKKILKESKNHEVESSRNVDKANESKEEYRIEKYVQLKDSKILKQTLGHIVKEKEKKSKNTIKKLNILAEFELTPEERQKYNPPSPTIESLKSSIAAIGGTQERKKKPEAEQKVTYDIAKAGRRIRKKPCARDGHSGALSGSVLYIFGGDRHTMDFNDLYMIDLSAFPELQVPPHS